MDKEKYFIELDEESVLKIPYHGPLTRRIYVISEKNNRSVTSELFVQKMDAFTTNLIVLLNRLRNHEITEIRYSCGLDGFMRIFLNEKGKLIGEYLCKTQKSLDSLKAKLGIP